MARPKTSVGRLDNLRKTFQSNKGKVLSTKQVQDAVGAAYWRVMLKNLKDEGMNIESVRSGRAVAGYKYTGTDTSHKTVVVKAEKTTAQVAASKPKKTTKPAAKKTTTKGKKVEKASDVVDDAPVALKEGIDIEETQVGEEDPDVLAILEQAGLGPDDAV